MTEKKKKNEGIETNHIVEYRVFFNEQFSKGFLVLLLCIYHDYVLGTDISSMSHCKAKQLYFVLLWLYFQDAQVNNHWNLHRTEKQTYKQSAGNSFSEVSRNSQYITMFRQLLKATAFICVYHTNTLLLQEIVSILGAGNIRLTVFVYIFINQSSSFK